MRADAAPAFVWAAELGRIGERLRLAEQESRYVARVCRARIGESVTLTDGRGGLARARIESVHRLVEVVIESVDHVSPTRRAEVLCGPLESERGDWLVEKLAELGVAAFQPIHCERARWPPSDRLPRWSRLTRAALQQSRGRFEMDVRAPLWLEEAVDAIPDGTRNHVADPGGEPAGRMGRVPLGACAVVVGPAEGLARAELERLIARGFLPMSLSGARLRAETAALVWAAWWAAPLEVSESMGGS